MGHETVYSSGLTEAEIRQWERDFIAYLGPLRESPEEIERSWQEWRKNNPPLPLLRERFGIRASDDRPYIFLSSRAANAFPDDANPREHFSRGVAVTPEMTGQDIVNALRGRRKTPNLGEFALVCLGGGKDKGTHCSMGGYSANIYKVLESLGIEPDRSVSETGIRLTPS